MSGPATEKLLRLVRSPEPAVARLFRLTFSDPSNFTQGANGRLTGSVKEATSGRSGAAGKAGAQGPVTATQAVGKTYREPSAADFAERPADGPGASRAVSSEEFQAIAATGQAQLDAMAGQSSPATGLTGDSLDSLKASGFAACQNSWGGLTIDAHTGVPLPDDTATGLAVTVRDVGQSAVTIDEHASQEEFNTAMDQAVAKFQPQLRSGSSYLGVFHDDANNRIDMDPVVVVKTPAEAEAIGAATYAIGGAYNYADTLGYFPPHVG